MRDPDLLQTFTDHPDWRAWKVKIEAPHATTIGLWLVDAPGASIGWSYYTVSVCHLRDVEGVPPAKLDYDGAEFELLIMALEPGKPLPDPDDWDKTRCSFLSPASFKTQFGGISDAQAFWLLDKLVALIVKGKLSPEASGPPWGDAMRSTIAATLACMSEGRHTGEGES